MTVPSVGKILNDAQVSLAVHKKCVKQMIQRRHADQDTFLPELCNAILPVLLEFKVRAPRLRAPRRAADPRLPWSPDRPGRAVPSTPLGTRETMPATRGDLRSAKRVFSTAVFERPLADTSSPLAAFLSRIAPRPKPTTARPVR
jgi:hypothetical protein